MTQIKARIVSVHADSNDDLSKQQLPSIQAELNGIVGDRHRSYFRKAWAGDKQPKGTVLKFPSGAELIVEEYNPPCHDMGKILARNHKTNSGEPLSTTAFSKVAKLTRGVVGVVEVAGVINEGDEVTVILYEPPKWLARSSD